MSTRRKTNTPTKLVAEWPLLTAATLGSSVRAKGILLEVRAHLPIDARKLLDVEGVVLTLRAPGDADEEFRRMSVLIAKTLRGIEARPVIPREVEDILTISSTERHRWLKDGRLQSAGTRTVKLRGRARKITFHVFDPVHIEDILDRDLTAVWREDDALAAAEKRRRAAGKAALTRAGKNVKQMASIAPDGVQAEPLRLNLKGWDEFELNGLLR